MFRDIKMEKPSAEGVPLVIDYVEPHQITVKSGKYYHSSKRMDGEKPSNYWVRQGVVLDRPLTLVDLKGMRKSFKKFVKKNFPNKAAELIKKIDTNFDEFIVDQYSATLKTAEAQQLITFLRDHPTNHQAIKDMSLREAINFAGQYMMEKEDPEKIVIKYDKGFYWYSLGYGGCDIEAERMGHCGADDRGALYSLRSKKKNQKLSKSHVTIAYNEHSHTVFQIKGKSNCTPEPKMGPYIVDFLEKMRVHSVLESGEHSDCDFTEFMNYLMEKYPDADYEDPQSKVDNAISEINEGNFNTEYVTFYADDVGWDADTPMLRIDANVGFTVQMDFLEDYHDLDFIEQLFDEDREAIEEKIIDECDFEDYDTYSDGLQLTWDTQYELPRLVVSLNLSPYNNDTATDLDEAEENMNNIKYAYEASDIEGYIKIIKKITYKQFEDVLNPDGREIYQDILDNIEKLQDEFQIFNIEGDEDEIYVSGEVELPIAIKPIINAGRYSSADFNRAFNFYTKYISRGINHQRYAEKIDDLMDTAHKAIIDATARQIKLPFQDLDIEDPKTRFEKPYGFNIDVAIPSDMKLRRSEAPLKPKIKIDLELSNLDNKATLLYALQYIRFLEERLPKIINKLNFADTQKFIDNAYKKATQSIEGYVPKSLEENKKRKIKVKFRR